MREIKLQLKDIVATTFVFTTRPLSMTSVTTTVWRRVALTRLQATFLNTSQVFSVSLLRMPYT